MDDLSAMLNQVMSDPESMRKIQALASSLGLGGSPVVETPAPPPPPPAPAPAESGGADLSALASLLSGLNQPQQQPQQQAPKTDLSALAQLLSDAKLAGQPAAQNSEPAGLGALSGLLGGLSGGAQNTSPSGVSTLTALLNGGNTQPQAPSGILPNLDTGTIIKLTQALSSLQNNRSNIDLLLALKPRLKEERSKKVDDAIRVMQLIQFLPLIKESGLFGEMDKILGGLGGGNGAGLSGLLGNVGNGLGGLLGGLGRR